MSGEYDDASEEVDDDFSVDGHAAFFLHDFVERVDGSDDDHLVGVFDVVVEDVDDVVFCVRVCYHLRSGGGGS